MEITINGEQYSINIEKLMEQGLIAPAKKEIEYIDLGLPSGTLWATENADDKYYTFDEAVEKFSNQLPTRAQFYELADYCDYRFDADTKEGVFTRDGKELRFPASGYFVSGSGASNNVGDNGNYQSCSPEDATCDYALYFSCTVDPIFLLGRSLSASVRCVKTNFK